MQNRTTHIISEVIESNGDAAIEKLLYDYSKILSVPFEDLEQMKCELKKQKEIAEANIIQARQFPYARPVFLVNKNKFSDLFASIIGMSYNSQEDYETANINSVDFNSGYHQIPMHPDCVEKTAFLNLNGHF